MAEIFCDLLVNTWNTNWTIDRFLTHEIQIERFDRFLTHEIQIERFDRFVTHEIQIERFDRFLTHEIQIERLIDERELMGNLISIKLTLIFATILN